MNYLLPAIGLFSLLFSAPPKLGKTYYSANKAVGAHAFTVKLIIGNSHYSYTQYPTSATPLYRAKGEYKIKGDTLILWKGKVFTVDYRYKPRTRRIIPCPTAPDYSCGPDYYLIRQDSLLSIYYSEKEHEYHKGSLFLIASH